MTTHRKIAKVRNAFSLLELLLAIALLSTFLSIAIPSFYHSYMRHRVMETAIFDVIESIQTCKRLAIERSVPFVYEFEAGTNRQTLYPVDQSLPKRTKLLHHEVQLQNSKEVLVEKSSTKLVFREDGSCDNFTLIVNMAGQSQSIVVDRNLGIPHRVSMKKEYR